MEQTLPSESSQNVQFSETGDAGLLIVFEGLDGSGKTTQRKLLKSWLKTLGEEVVVTKWNSSPLLKPVIKARKANRLLDPHSYATLHAADFWHRYETVIQPSLSDGKIVLADRYVFTGLTRDIARGMNRQWCMQLYERVRKPDIVFYLKAPAHTCAARIAASRRLKFYEAGQDVTGLKDAYESYLRFANRMLSEYERLNQQIGFVIIAAEKPVYEQHHAIRDAYFKLSSRAAVPPVCAPQLHAVFSQVDV